MWRKILYLIVSLSLLAADASAAAPAVTLGEPVHDKDSATFPVVLTDAKDLALTTLAIAVSYDSNIVLPKSEMDSQAA